MLFSNVFCILLHGTCGSSFQVKRLISLPRGFKKNFMFMEWKRSRLRFINKPHLFCCISIFFFLSISALFCITASFTTICPESTCLFSAKADHTYFQELERPMNKMMSSSRRYLGGLGSSPPRCLWKCGNCTPCKPVHVPVPPGTPVTAEYYPEAWRCKCGNKLYMP